MGKSPYGFRSPSPLPQGPGPRDSVPKASKSREQRTLKCASQLDSRVQRRPPRIKQPKPANRNIYSSLHQEIPINERLFAQAQTLPETTNSSPMQRRTREEQIDMVYYLANYVNPPRISRRNTSRRPDLSRWGVTDASPSMTQDTPTPGQPGAFSAYNIGPDIGHRRAHYYAANKAVAHTGAQFEEYIDSDDMDIDA
ncbi:hypothetical protein TWF718_007921 [Orbilia javanica]|uniref:Uncharacterized protein n=1 Tax=Orbilia javanica TaxID=47235 RepID=A0AAN8NTC3_9PEZI